MCRMALVVSGVLIFGVAVQGEPYWFNYDPPEYATQRDNWLPEVCCGWTHDFGQYNGGSPADVRWIENGCLVIDSRADPWSWDFATREPQLIDPGPREYLVVEWRLFVTEPVGYGLDAAIWLAGDVNEEIAFVFRPDRMGSVREHWTYDLAPGDFHAFRLVAPDTVTYELWLDSVHILDGHWVGPTGNHSLVSWGDMSVSESEGCVSHWDYLQFGRISAGDMNRDEVVDFADIDPFLAALTMTEEEYQSEHPKLIWRLADCNKDGQVDFDDIDPFIAIMSSADGP